MTAHQDRGASDLKIGLIGLGIGLVWIVLIGAFSHWIAL